MLLVQDDLLIASRLATVMVVPLTTNLQRGKALGNVLLSANATGLGKDSVALVCQVLTLDKAFLDELAGSLPRRVLLSVDAGLQLALDLRP